MGAIMALAPIVAPMIGGVLQTAFGWRASFICGAVRRAGCDGDRLAAAAGDAAAARAGADSLAGMVLRAIAARCGIARSRPSRASSPSSFAGLFAWISGSPFVLQDIYRLVAARLRRRLRDLQRRLHDRHASRDAGGHAGSGSTAPSASGRARARRRRSCDDASRSPLGLRRRSLAIVLPIDALSRRPGPGDAAGHGGGAHAVSRPRRRRLLADRLRAAELGRDPRRDRRPHARASSAWPMAGPLAAMGLIALIVWAIVARRARIRDEAQA